MKPIEKRFRLKELQQQLPEKEVEYKEAQSQSSAKQKEVQRVRNEIIDLQNSLTTTTDSIGVSDHAVLRYMERKYDIDIHSIREEILTPTIRRAIEGGVNSIKVNDISFKVSNKTITTII